MAGLQAEYFYWAGKFSAFVPGNKSFYQYLSMTVVSTDLPSDVATGSPAEQKPSDALLDTTELHQVRLNKALQRMMYAYLDPQDWIKVAGQRKLDKATGELVYEASEIIKLSSAQVLQLPKRRLAKDSGERETKKVDKVRVLVCQQSACRQRGSAQMSQVIASLIARSPNPANITLTATDCLKSCKLGPNLVITHSTQQSHRAKSARYHQVSPAKASKIVQTVMPSDCSESRLENCSKNRPDGHLENHSQSHSGNHSGARM